jgi:hypothetical protein
MPPPPVVEPLQVGEEHRASLFARAEARNDGAPPGSGWRRTPRTGGPHTRLPCGPWRPESSLRGAGLQTAGSYTGPRGRSGAPSLGQAAASTTPSPERPSPAPLGHLDAWPIPRPSSSTRPGPRSGIAPPPAWARRPDPPPTAGWGLPPQTAAPPGPQLRLPGGPARSSPSVASGGRPPPAPPPASAALRRLRLHRTPPARSSAHTRGAPYVRPLPSQILRARSNSAASSRRLRLSPRLRHA